MSAAPALVDGVVSNLVVDCNDLGLVSRFWSGLLGLAVTESDEQWADLEPLPGGRLTLSFQRVPERKEAKNRLHLDITVPDVEAAGRRAAVLGAQPAGPLHVPADVGPWRVWRDPEGNEFCLLTRAG
ncbi:VOC family protein [Motilibacter deserti]|uniref:VOC family protein n=1 Tax=Motilibacter deserti TaxID=2714956 RepID=A0ABX0GRV8_9ACTN|nr:VOC family protein [Motilibacter deserti]NHC13594.1 VOC family protein [Motilibacter deserti]